MKHCKKILVVDDDEAIRESVSYLLEIENYKVLQAKDGLDAIDLLLSLPEAELPGLIILDMMMPRLDGQGFLKMIESINYSILSEIPIVIASANANFITGASSFAKIKKPFEIKVLLDLAHQFCGDPVRGNSF